MDSRYFAKTRMKLECGDQILSERKKRLEVRAN